MKSLLSAVALGLLISCVAHAQTVTTSCSTAGTDNAFLGIQTIRLWPGDAPQA